MTPDGTIALRRAAAIAHGIPWVRVRLGDGTRTLAEVGLHGRPRSDDAVLLRPCQFRSAVATAWWNERIGHPMAPIGMCAHRDPTVSIGVPTGGRIGEGGLVRTELGGMPVLGFVTVTDPTTAERLVADAVDRLDPDVADTIDVHVRADLVLGTSLVTVTLPERSGAPDTRAIMVWIEELQRSCLVAELSHAPATR